MTQGATKLLEDEHSTPMPAVALKPPAEPEMPYIKAAQAGPRTDWEEKARRFHRFGPSPAARLDAMPDSGFDWGSGASAVLLPLQENRPGLPAVLIPPQGRERSTVQPIDLVLDQAIEAVRGAGRPARILGEILPRLVRRISKRAREEKLPTSLHEVARKELEALITDLDLGGESGESLEEDSRELLASLPQSWLLLGPSTGSEHLAIELVRHSREPARAEFAKQARAMAEHVDNLLLIDQTKGASKGLDEGLRDGLSKMGLSLIDHEELARLHPDRKARRLEDTRRKRLQSASKVLGEWLEKNENDPLAVYLVGSEEAPAPSSEDSAPLHISSTRHARPLSAAAELFLEAAEPIVELAKAMRVARLEMSGSYRPEIHDDAISAIDWQALKPEELALVPPVIVSIDYSRILTEQIGDLCQLVWSGRPVLVVASGPSPNPNELSDLTKHQPSLGTLMLTMHHAWVLQSSTARPCHLARGLLEADPCRPSVALIAEAETPMFGEAAVAGRAWPLFVFRPGDKSGELDLTDNPSHTSDWPSYSIEVRRGKNRETIDVTATFTEAAAATTVGREHLFPLPTEGWSEELVPLDEWILHADRDKPGGPLPYVWLIADDGCLFKAVASRALALATADRLRHFRMLQEMAGVGGVHLVRAREEARAEVLAQADAEKSELEKERDEAVAAASREATREAMSGLAAALLREGALESALSGSARVSAAPAAAPAEVEDTEDPEEQAEPEEEDDEEEDLLDHDPWINTPLCTSCNDCFKINELLFHYDENKQAHITDPSKGTYADLVRSAEICPAKCIHPGKPRHDDPTATPEMIARGSEF